MIAFYKVLIYFIYDNFVSEKSLLNVVSTPNVQNKNTINIKEFSFKKYYSQYNIFFRLKKLSKSYTTNNNPFYKLKIKATKKVSAALLVLNIKAIFGDETTYAQIDEDLYN